MIFEVPGCIFGGQNRYEMAKRYVTTTLLVTYHWLNGTWNALGGLRSGKYYYTTGFWLLQERS